MTVSHTPAPHLPTHHTWVFDPVSGEVTISDDNEKERRHRGHHAGLAEKVVHPDRVHGFAYRIHGGWRVTDWDHKAVDTYIVKQVVAALNDKEK